MKPKKHQLQFITHFNDRYSYLDSAYIGLEGGCKWIQLRMKNADDTTFEQTALNVQSMCKAHGATFVINDNIRLAKKIGADGVHLGKSDVSICEARKYLGHKFIIGATVNTFEDILSILQNATPDYFGCGPFRFTTTKQDLSPSLGFEGYKYIVDNMKANNINIPLIAIGGIKQIDIPTLMQCGINGIALSGSILNAEAPITEMQLIDNLITELL